MIKRIAVDLAKSVYQVAESVRVGQVSQRKRLSREAFRKFIQEQAEPVELGDGGMLHRALLGALRAVSRPSGGVDAKLHLT